jgi:chaperone modulatory protein CbpM
MIRFAAILRRLPQVPAPELNDWIARGWIEPRGSTPDWEFTEIDVARAQLIRDLRQMALDDEAVPVVLSLLDQMYDLRQTLHAVAQAIEEQPDPVRMALAAALKARLGEGRS